MGGLAHHPLSPPLTPPADSSKTPDEYQLPRGGREAVRLTAQHYMLKDRQGWLLHPNVAQALENIARPQIVDVATGTGIWAMEAAQQYPHADVLGLDISDEQFFPQWTLPSNMSLGLGDVLEEAPEEYRGKFDVVHVRLLLNAGPDVDKSIFLNHFRSLLKPGGWLQWDDLSFPNTYALYPTKHSQDASQMVLLQDHPVMVCERKYFGMGRKAGWFSQFDTVMAEAGGFDEVLRYEPPRRPHLLQIETDLSVTVHTSVLEKFLVREKLEGRSMSATSMELQNAINVLHEEANAGVLFSYAWNIGIARKL